MAEDPNLNGLNSAANANPTDEHVAVQKIKSDDKTVGGVDLGAVDNVELTGEDRLSMINSAVETALKFKPVRMRSKAVLTAAAQLRQDFLGVNTYVAARTPITRQLDRMIPKKRHETVSDRQQRVNGLILEKILTTRLQEVNKTGQQNLRASKNLLKFQTTVATTFMRQSLALQYNQLFTIKDLLTVTKAFADMAENKLEAIKINTRLPDIKKKTLLDMVKEMAMQKALKSAGKAAVTFLSHESMDDVRNSMQNIRDRISDKIQKVRNFSLNSTRNYSADSSEPKAPMMDRLRESARPENLWKNTKAPREFLAELIKKTAMGEEKKSPDVLLSRILEEITKQGSGIRTVQTGGEYAMGSSSIIAKQLNTINMAVLNFKTSYDKNASRLYDLIFNIDKTLTEMPVMVMGGGPGGGSFDGGPATPPTKDSRIGSATHKARRFLSKFRPPFFRAKHFVFTDVYRKDDVEPGNPLVTKEQLDRGSVTRVDGKPVKSLRDLNVPILDIATGQVLISQKDIKQGLVDVNNQPFKGANAFFGSGMGGLLWGTAKIPFAVAVAYGKFIVGGANATSRFLFKKRDKSPYADVYLKGNVILGRPLVTGQKFREGLIFSDGSRVLDVSKIDKPVIDPKTGQTLITQEDIDIGLVDAFGEPIGNRRASFSAVGGVFDVSKVGIKTAGSLVSPLLNMYASIFKILPKTIMGVGSFLSKSIIGILSGKAPGAIAKGLVGITGSITKMYASMFGMGLQGVGAVGKTLFGRLFGGRKSSMGNLTKKDIYELISVRLDHIYSLLDMRLANNNVRPGSYQDHENRLMRDRERLLHIKEEEEQDSPATGKAGILSRLAAVLGIGGAGDQDDLDDSDKSSGGSGGIIGNIKNIGELAAGSYLGKKISPYLAKLKGLKKIGSGLTSAAKNVLKFGSKAGIEEGAEIGAKAIGKSLPGLGTYVDAGFAVDDVAHGDFVGAGGNAAASLATLVPFVGTAAAFSINGWLLYRDANKIGADKGISPYLKARMQVYGADSSSADNIKSLEARTLQAVIANGSNQIHPAEAKAFAKSFGFDPTNGAQFQYFCNWLDNRFRNGYLTYLATVKKHGYNVTAADEIKEADSKKIISEYTSSCASFVSTYSKLVPNLSGFRNSGSKAVSAPTPTAPFQSNTPNSTPAPAAPASPLPIVNAAYVVPNSGGPSSYTGAPQSFNTSNGNTGVAQTQELTYTPRGANDNGSGFRPFNGASVPGANGGIQQSMAVQMAAARASYNNNSPSGTTPTGHAYFGFMYNALLSAAKAQGIPNPEIVAQLGAAQTSLETGYGKHVPGNNAFGIKGVGPDGSTSDSTQEFINGQMITENQGFRKYKNVAQSAADYITFLKTNERYRGVLAAKTIEEAVQAQANSGYATDPNYGTKLASIVSSPENIGSINNSNTSNQVVVANNSTTTQPMVQTTQPQGAGPSSTVIAPIQNAVSVAETTQQATAAITQNQGGVQSSSTPMVVQAAFHPDVINAIRAQSVASQKSLDALGNIHSTMSGIFNHLQDVHGPDGIFNTIADNISNATAPPQPTVFAPTINSNQQTQDNDCNQVGFSVKKKRDQRYSV